MNCNNATRFQVPGMVLFPTITLATDTILNAGCNTVTATLSNNAKPGLVVSPNPASNRFLIVLPQAGAATVPCATSPGPGGVGSSSPCRR